MPASYTAAEIISLTNAIRQANGLEPLHPDQLLMQAAEHKAQAMVDAGSWSHNTPSATSWQFLDNVGYHYQLAGENLARNFDTPKQVVDGWLNSPTHRENLLNSGYTQIGVAVATGSADSQTSILVVQYLGTPTLKTESAAGQFNPTDMVSFSPAPPYWLLVFLPVLAASAYVRIRHYSRTLPPTAPPPKTLA